MTGRIYSSGPISLADQINPVHEKGFSLSSYYRCLPDPFPSDPSEPISFSNFYNTQNENFHRFIFKSENGLHQSYDVPQGVTKLNWIALGAGGKGSNVGEDYITGGGGAGAEPTNISITTNPAYDTVDVSLGRGDITSATVITGKTESQAASPGSSALGRVGGTGTYYGGSGTYMLSNGSVVTPYSLGGGPNHGTVGPIPSPYWMTYGEWRYGSSGGASTYSHGGSSALAISYPGEYGGGGCGGYSSGKIYQYKISAITWFPLRSTFSHKTTYYIQNMPNMFKVSVKAPRGQTFNSVRVKHLGSGAVKPTSLLQQCVERGSYDGYFAVNNLPAGNLGQDTTDVLWDSGVVVCDTRRKEVLLPDSITSNLSTIAIEVQGAFGNSDNSNATVSVHNKEVQPKKVKFLPQYWNQGYWGNNWWWGYDWWYNRWNSDWAWWGYWGNYGYWDGYGYSYWNYYGWWDYYSVVNHIDNYENWNEDEFLDGDYYPGYWNNNYFYYNNWWWGNNYAWNWSWYWNYNTGYWENKIPVISAENYADFTANTGLHHYYLSNWNSWYWGAGNWNWYYNIGVNAGIEWITPTVEGMKSLPAGKYIMLGGHYQYYWLWSGWYDSTWSAEGMFMGGSWNNWNSGYWYAEWIPQHIPFIVSGGDLVETVIFSEGKSVTTPPGYTAYDISNDPDARISVGQYSNGGDGVAFVHEWVFEKPGTWYLTVPQDQQTLEADITGYGGVVLTKTLSNLVNGQEIAIIVGDINNKMSAVDTSYNGVLDLNYADLGGNGSLKGKVVIRVLNIDYSKIKAAK